MIQQGSCATFWQVNFSCSSVLSNRSYVWALSRSHDRSICLQAFPLFLNSWQVSTQISKAHDILHRANFYLTIFSIFFKLLMECHGIDDAVVNKTSGIDERFHPSLIARTLESLNLGIYYYLQTDSFSAKNLWLSPVWLWKEISSLGLPRERHKRQYRVLPSSIHTIL